MSGSLSSKKKKVYGGYCQEKIKAPLPRLNVDRELEEIGLEESKKNTEIAVTTRCYVEIAGCAQADKMHTVRYMEFAARTIS